MVTSSRWVGVLVLGLLSQGCSFLFVDGPPDRHEKLAYFDCTSSAGPEVVDITYAVLFGTAAAAASGNSGDSGGVATTLAATGVFGASAIYGIVQTTDCNKAKDALRIRLMRVYEREARLTALEAQQKRGSPPPNVLSHPPRLPKRKKQKPVQPLPVVLDDELPNAPPPPSGALPPAPPAPASAVPAPAAPSSSALPPAPPPPPAAPPPPPTARPAPPTAPPVAPSARPAPPVAPPAPDR
jgi:hypothetical protein